MEFVMNQNLAVISRILGRCFVFTFIVACLWFAVYALPGSPFYSMQLKIFGLSAHEADLLNYGGIGLLKLVMWLFFFAPWLAIRMELRKKAVSSN
jgi:hypothetical protein